MKDEFHDFTDGHGVSTKLQDTTA